MNEQPKQQSILSRIRNSILLKLGVIGLLMLILMIPASMVENLVHERQNRKFEAVDEISSKWGGAQTITGPIISVPYEIVNVDSKGKSHTQINHLYILPETLKTTGEIHPEIRYRGIYKVVLYSGTLNIQGSFNEFDKQAAEIADGRILWNKAVLSLGITDLRGIRESVGVKINGKDIPISAGSRLQNFDIAGVNCKLQDPEKEQKIDFEISLSLNGSQQISFIPVGKTTEIELKSSWNSPSFDGAYLPVERKISDTGFTARWRIFEFNRNFPQIFKNNSCNFAQSAFGVRLFIGNDIYQQSMRTVKYAVLFIVFTFATIFLAEIISHTRVHPFQYLMTGLAVTIFYVLLISISEHLNFSIAYLLSSTAIVLLIFSYIKCIFEKLTMPIVIAVIQIVLYVYFYITLQSEDYALLMGSLGLFTLLAAVMYVTRKINWHNLNLDE